MKIASSLSNEWIEEMEVDADEARLLCHDENGREYWQSIPPEAAITTLEEWRENRKRKHELETKDCQHGDDDFCDCQFQDIALRDALGGIDAAIRDLQTRK